MTSFLFLTASASGQIGGQRLWTDTQRRKVEAKLIKIEADSVVIKMGIKKYRIELGKLSETDRRYYVEGLRPNPPAGEVTEYPIHPPEELKEWLEENNMRSL